MQFFTFSFFFVTFKCFISSLNRSGRRWANCCKLERVISLVRGLNGNEKEITKSSIDSFELPRTFIPTIGNGCKLWRITILIFTVSYRCAKRLITTTWFIVSNLFQPFKRRFTTAPTKASRWKILVIDFSSRREGWRVYSSERWL